MSIQKTSAVILSIMPYRESSAIVTLYTSDYGRISGIAKGIKRRLKYAVPLERGFLVDLLIYNKNNRDLHTLADIQIAQYYPQIRDDLYKTAIRDAAFELLIKSVLLSDSHPELFSLLNKFLEILQITESKERCFFLLWKFYFKVADLLGFAIHLETCRICGQSSLIANGGFLIIESGGLYCTQCASKRPATDTFVNGEVLRSIIGSSSPASINHRELMRVTKIAASYCRFHLDIKNEFKTLQFIEQML